MTRCLALFAAVLASACVGAATVPVPAASVPAPTPSAAPSRSAPATPSATPTPIALPSIATISAPSADVVWTLVGSSRLFRSTDRGASWTEGTLPVPPGPVGDIAFVNDREGWLLSPGSPATGCQSQGVAVWHTTDGAASWDRVYQSATPGGDPLCKDALFFADAQHGWMTLSSPNSPSVIARTADGGRTWTRGQPLANPPGFVSAGPGYTLRAGRVRAFGLDLVVDALGNGAGNGLVYAFRSADSGATWTYATTGPTRDATSIIFTSAARWLQIAPPDRSTETTDRGATWHAFATDYQQAAPIAPQIVFGDPNVGYATVRGSIQRTTDGGAHWTHIGTPGTQSP